MNKVLEVKNISKIYKVYTSNFNRLKEIFTKKIFHKEFISNKDISFSLYEGETLGIIGINGAGKSTILKIIAGVVEPTTGQIIRKGRITALLELGTGFNNEMTGYENIFLNGTLIGMNTKECISKQEDIIAFSELGKYIYEPIKTYSSGMKMRLAFSIAIYSDPKILIVDEALSVGDAHFSAKCTKALKQRKEKNMSIIYVSHDLNSLKLLCDRVILLNNGEIIKEGTPEETINNYNFLISKLNDKDDKITLSDNARSSFGSFDVIILSANIKGVQSQTNTITSGEETEIKLSVESKIDLESLNIGILIRNKFGQDIFGTTSKNLGREYKLEKNKTYIICYKFPLDIGIGKYSISAALTNGEDHLDTCYHWLDDAAEFQVISNIKEKFIGMCKLKPTISIKEIINA